MAEEHPQDFWKGDDELSMRKMQQDFLIMVFGKEKCFLLAVEGTKIKPLHEKGRK